MIVLSDKQIRDINSLSIQCITDETSEVRNKLFVLIKPCILYWITSSFRNIGFECSKSDSLSISWDCFLFCLKYYKNKGEIPFFKHSYSYSKFYVQHLINIRNREEEGVIPFEESSQYRKMDVVFSPHEFMQGISNFRKILPKEYKLVFDNTLKHIIFNTSNQRSNDCLLPRSSFIEAVKIFKIIINFLMHR